MISRTFQKVRVYLNSRKINSEIIIAIKVKKALISKNYLIGMMKLIEALNIQSFKTNRNRVVKFNPNSSVEGSHFMQNHFSISLFTASHQVIQLKIEKTTGLKSQEEQCIMCFITNIKQSRYSKLTLMIKYCMNKENPKKKI